MKTLKIVFKKDETHYSELDIEVSDNELSKLQKAWAEYYPGSQSGMFVVGTMLLRFDVVAFIQILD